eukprot:scaffold100330_cov35-Tisochrysis_lutea.AAC.2
MRASLELLMEMPTIFSTVRAGVKCAQSTRHYVSLANGETFMYATSNDVRTSMEHEHSGDGTSHS